MLPRRVRGRMMGRILAVALLVALAIPVAPAGSSAPRPFAGEATFCHPFHTLDVRPGELCPRVAHAGTLAPGACEADACALLVTVQSDGAGVPLLRKTLSVDVSLDGFGQGGPVCAATAEDALVSCQAQSVVVSLALEEGACRLLRVGSLLREAADVPPTLPVRAENGFLACRAGATLTLE